jgi:putative nucleotidyltransferase with HDIG domain
MESMTITYSGVNVRAQLDEKLGHFLAELKKEEYMSTLSYILRELVNNGDKANLKRAHFLKLGLDITKYNEYQAGIKTFKDSFTTNTEEYYTIADTEGYFVEVNLLNTSKVFSISVINSNPLMDEEKRRITDKLRQAARFTNVEEVFASGLDQTEGGGFGLILVVLMLRKIGIDENSLKVHDNENFTRVEIEIPLHLINQENSEFLADAVTSEIETIPQFPQHVNQVISILGDPSKTFKDIAVILRNDPAMIADLLKTANSSRYMPGRQVESIDMAVRLLGFETIKNIVINYSSSQILMNKYNLHVIKRIMNHSEEVAIYAYLLGRLLVRKKEILDKTFIAAMLHDIGKIISKSVSKDTIEKIDSYCIEKGIPSAIIEGLSESCNHSLIGANLAKKWNFPDFLVESIKYHHIPLEANDDHRELVSVIYLANVIYHYKRGNFKYENINFVILKQFHLQRLQIFKNMVTAVDKNYQIILNMRRK